MTTPTPEDPQQQPGYQPPPPPPPSYQAPPPGQPPYQPNRPGYPVMTPDQERLWAGMAHWGSIVGAFIVFAFLAPLLVLLVKGKESPFVRRHAVESLNFQISMLIYGVISAILILVLIGLILLAGLAVLWIVTVIMASVKASNGEDYRYPLTIRFVS